MATKKKTPAKKTTKKKASTKSQKACKYKSFKLCPEKFPFKTYKVTEQTVYWGILFIIILVLCIWVLNIQLDLIKVIDSISTT